MFIKNLIITVVLLFLTQSGLGQFSASGTYPSHVYQGNAAEVQARKTIYNMERNEAMYNRLKWNMPPNGGNSNGGRFGVRNKYTRKKSINFIKPREFEKRYKQFLKQPNTGIIKLIAKNNCAKTFVFEDKDKESDLIEKCPSFFITGGASYYSFRKDDYALPILADLGNAGGWLFSVGLLNQGILVDLGDVDLAGIDSRSIGMTNLFEYVPETDVELAEKQRENLETGFVSGKYLYSGVVKLEESATYGLRVIAYDNNPKTEINTMQGRVTVNRLPKDKRKDIIVVFRVIEKAENGSAVILWKQLQIKDSPKLIN